MVTEDSNPTPVRPKRKAQERRQRQKRRHRLRQKSVKLVKSGRIELTPCIVCGSTQNLTIHHVGPLEHNRFVFLCKKCHLLAHKPVFRKMQVCVASGHFSVLPQAALSPTNAPPAIGPAPVKKRSTSPCPKGHGPARLDTDGRTASTAPRTN